MVPERGGNTGILDFGGDLDRRLYLKAMKPDARISHAPAGQAGPMRLSLPRVSGLHGTRAGILGLALLLLLSTLGAVTVHIVEYHLGLGSSGDWRLSALAMLAQCPLSGGLLIVILCTLGVTFAVLWRVRLLTHRHRQLTAEATRAGLVPASPHVALPRDPGRFLALLVPLLLGQLGAYMLVDHLWPMGSLMRMDGALMTMPANGAVPLLPLQLAVAILLTALVWRLERRLTVLQVVIATIRRLLTLFLNSRVCVPITPGPAAGPLSAWVAPGLLSRPPPFLILTRG
jgi:hypothetical protein